MDTAFVVIFLFIALIPGIILFLVGFLNRKPKESEQRVKVQAYVVEFTNWTRPARVVFDYPLPNGQWSRQAKRVSVMPDHTGKNKLGLVAWVKPGHPFPVYVNPANPHDVSIGAAGVARLFPILAMVAGSGLILVFFSTLIKELLA